MGEQPVLVSSQLDRGSEPQSPAEGLAGSRAGARSRSTGPLSTLCQSRTGQPAFGGPALEAARQGNLCPGPRGTRALTPIGHQLQGTEFVLFQLLDAPDGFVGH